MVKKNFSDSEISALVVKLGSKMNVSINRAGNIKVSDLNEPPHKTYWGKTIHGFWVLYRDKNYGYLWRHHDGSGYCYPLNMRGRKNKGNPFVWTDREGHVHKVYYRPYDITNSYFTSFDEALNYFVNYLKTYRNINV